MSKDENTVGLFIENSDLPNAICLRIKTVTSWHKRLWYISTNAFRYIFKGEIKL